MFDFERPYLAGATLIFISALLHFVALVLSGFAGIGLTLGVAGLIYLLFAYGLAKGLRWLAYVAFIVVFILSMWVVACIPWKLLFDTEVAAPVGHEVHLWGEQPDGCIGDMVSCAMDAAHMPIHTLDCPLRCPNSCRLGLCDQCSLNLTRSQRCHKII